MNVLNQELGAKGFDSESLRGALGLKEKDFQQIAKNGFGDRHNAYPHSMVWFKDHLYVGTTKSVLILLRNHSEDLKAWETFPVKCPKEIWELDLRSQIWRYHPPTQKWSKVFVSPIFRTEDGLTVSVFNGVRNMLIFQGKSDAHPVLYALSMSHEKGPGAMLLRSEDGLNFEQIKISGIEGEIFSSYRPLVNFKGHLYTAPVGKNRAQNGAGFAVVFESDDPLNGKWTQVNETDFADPSNLSIFEMAAFNGHLYAGTLNANGYQLWKTDCASVRPYRWKKILTHGADRGATNEGVASMVEFNGALYVGSLIQNGGFDRKNLVGPNPPELIRVYPDDSWDIVVGDPRMTSGSLKIPLSGQASGFGNFFNGYFWRMCVHEGWLYLGTLDWSVFLPYAPRDKWTEQQRNMIDDSRTEDLLRKEGGFDLWRSRDGVYWSQVTRRGFGNPYNYGVRTMYSTRYGLFLGIANPFGEDIAVKRTAGWFYEPNVQGGCEIWLGRQGSYDEKLRCYLDESLAEARDSFESISAASPEANQKYCERIIDEYYGNSHFRNFGFWTNATRDAREACQNLVEELLVYLPEKSGKILDLACRYGGTTRSLLKYYSAGAITGICLEKKELDRAQENIAVVRFLRPIIAKIGEKDASFDTVMSVEQLSGYSIGLAWLKEAVRLLKPGGYLLGAQILSQGLNSPWRKEHEPGSRPITSPLEFKELLLSLGLEDVRTVDCTNACWRSFRQNLDLYLQGKRFVNEIDDKIFDEATQSLYGCYGQIYAYVLMIGRKRKDKSKDQ